MGGGGDIATVMGGTEFWGIPGWRCVFILMASSFFLFVVDPMKTTNLTHDSSENLERDALVEKGSNARSTVIESRKATKAVIIAQTFQVIELQGIVGSLPWTATVFFFTWFELTGFDHISVAALISILAVGALLGGIIGDRISRVYPHSGRIMCAQFSAFMGIPFCWFLLSAIPQSINSWFAFSSTLLLMGLTISWKATAADAPVFAEVVPANQRTMIYAFDQAFELSLSSFAALLVWILSEKIYGYDVRTVDSIKRSADGAFALSKGLLSMMVVPFGLCCTPLYRIFKWDRDNARLASLKEEEIT